ncbi:hypothetical protein AMAG_14599 [Allomyces macrogynus ATCC 38327]|uniref:Vasohibin-domain-containing protein n=1 Tax=Allomyces macrogynus (strain ATCC 38327) TaxID=578462 RepID=A0A0L0T6T4_ALLM3|nr:hypothetical protein AMAG_14599 [Allomyces macrogynus ATCC 38327]|eukprot:KNE70473.1 hypothetical protein AMAG_14599 [Allomyces macrogynus ATCC 38327]
MDSTISPTALAALCDELEAALAEAGISSDDMPHDSAPSPPATSNASSSTVPWPSTTSTIPVAVPTAPAPHAGSPSKGQHLTLRRIRAVGAADPVLALAWCQRVITDLGYNHFARVFFPINKRASARSLATTARAMVALRLPIKCLEAVVLGAWLTAALTDVPRVPVAFKTAVDLPGAPKRVYRHIVLAVAVPTAEGERWGALGLSRRRELMDKPVQFRSLAALLSEYIEAYGRNLHKVLKIKIGLPFPHAMDTSTVRVIWKYLSLHLATRPTDSVSDDGDSASSSGASPTAASPAAPRAKHDTGPARAVDPAVHPSLAPHVAAVDAYWRDVRRNGAAVAAAVAAAGAGSPRLSASSSVVHLKGAG